MKKTATMGIRLPAEVRERLEQAAEKEGRSLNSEILVRVRRTFTGVGPLAHLSDADLVHELLSRHPGEPFLIQIGAINRQGPGS